MVPNNLNTIERYRDECNDSSLLSIRDDCSCDSSLRQQEPIIIDVDLDTESDLNEKLRHDILRGPAHRSTDVVNISSSEVVHRGLSLVGCGLKRHPQLEKLSTIKNKNFSTGDISTSKSDMGIYDSNTVPSDDIVEEVFDRLLKDGTFFWYDAIKNLKNISKRRKWALICKIQSNDSLVSPSTPANEKPNTSFSKENEFLYGLQKLLSNKSGLARTLYQLEKLLRQSAFCESFILLNLTETLASFATTISEENQFVYLRSFRSIMGSNEGRIAVLNSQIFVEYLCQIFSDQVTHLKIKLQSAELLLLLTYVDEQSGSERVLKHLNVCLESFFQFTTNLLCVDSSDEINNKPTPSFLQYSKTEELKKDFISTSLFLINSIVQVLRSKDGKVAFIKNLKELGIHQCFVRMKSLQSSVIVEQIEVYNDTERKLTEDISENLEWANLSFGPSLSILIKETKDTIIEQHLEKLFKLMLDILLFKPTSESIKVFKAFELILTYLVKNLDHEVSLDPDSLFHNSLNNFIDKIQSEEISNRGLKEIGELENVIKNLTDQIEELNDLKDLSKEEILQKLRLSNEQLKVKEETIEELKEKVERVEQMRRTDKKKFDQRMVHQDLGDHRIKTSTVFGGLLNQKNTNLKKISRTASLSKSHRVTSLASYIKRSNDCVDLSCYSSDHSGQLSSFVGAHKETGSIINAKRIDDFMNTGSHLNIASSQLPQSDQPVAPSLPCFLQKGNETSVLIENPALMSNFLNNDGNPPAHPPPPPPPLPNVLQNNVQSSSQVAPPPPPPLPLPLLPQHPVSTSMSDVNEDGHTDSTNPPPPPPPPPPFAFKPPQTPSDIPKVALKQIHWDKLGNIEDTLWEDESKRKMTLQNLVDGGILSDIENNFKIQERIPVQPKKTNRDADKKKSFLSRDLAHQFGINLHMFSGYSADEFAKKVLHCDSEIVGNVTALEFFNREDLVHISPNLLRSFAPYGTDYLNSAEPTKDPNELERSDRIFLELCYNLKSYWYERSFSLLVLTTYERDYYDLVYRLQKIDDAIQRLRNAAKLKDLLFIIIEIGNHMNKKNADGIKISSLSKLSFIKSSSDKDVSFIHFIERVIRHRYPDVYGFTEDLNKVEGLGKISLEHVEYECEEFCSKIETVTNFYTKGKLSDHTRLHPEDQIIEKTKLKLNRAKVKRSLLKDQLLLTTRDLKKLMKYFGENYNDRDAKSAFFDNFIEFSYTFKKCAKENMEKEETEKIYEQRKKLLESKLNSEDEQASDNEITNSTNNNLGSSLKNVAIDTILAKLRGVEKEPEPLRRRRSLKRLDTSSSESFANATTLTNDSNDVLLERTQAMLTGLQHM